MTGLSLVLFLGLLALVFLRIADERSDAVLWGRLLALQPTHPRIFNQQLVADLPEPARRYFEYTIEPGTALLPVATVEMEGKFGLGNKENPRYRTMRARQILAAPTGFLWILRTRGGLPVSGSDSNTWTRFRILGIFPVARDGKTPDHAQSAFGRYIAECLFWSPAALLLAENVFWEKINSHSVRVRIEYRGLSQSVDLTVDLQGRPVEIRFQRWSNANKQKKYCFQPFGGVMSDFRKVQGYRLPFKVEAGNLFGTPDYFPFFVAEVNKIHFPCS